MRQMKPKLQVMKFGGTSVGDAACIRRSATIVANAAREFSVAVVVSAMSGVTNRLIDAAHNAKRGDHEAGKSLAHSLRKQHSEALALLVPDDNKRAEVQRRIDEILAEGSRLYEGTALLRELTPRTLDAISSLGERLCAPVFAAALSQMGVDGCAIEATELIVTDSFHGGADPQAEPTRQRSQARIGPLLKNGQVPIITGFIGATADGVLTTLGRGGSDYSATILGAALDAEEIIIWTDVEGVLTADPRLVSEARTIPEISYREAAELAYFGAKVLHPATLLPAIHKNIPVYVLNSRNLKSTGTEITAQAPPSKDVFRAITAKTGISIVNVVASRGVMVHGFLRSVFEALDRHSTSVDIVAIAEISMSFTMETKRIPKALLSELEEIADVTCDDQQAIICLVGEDIHGKPGIAAAVFNTLAAAGVNIRMISQGASEINISTVVRESDVPNAVRKLHEHFFPATGHNKITAKQNGAAKSRKANGPGPRKAANEKYKREETRAAARA